MAQRRTAVLLFTSLNSSVDPRCRFRRLCCLYAFLFGSASAHRLVPRLSLKGRRSSCSENCARLMHKAFFFLKPISTGKYCPLQPLHAKGHGWQIFDTIG